MRYLGIREITLAFHRIFHRDSALFIIPKQFLINFIIFLSLDILKSIDIHKQDSCGYNKISTEINKVYKSST